MHETFVHPPTDPRQSPGSMPDSARWPCFALGGSPPHISAFAACSAAPSPLPDTADTPASCLHSSPPASAAPESSGSRSGFGLARSPESAAEVRSRLLGALVPKGGNRNPCHFAGTSLAHLVHAAQVVHHWAAARGLYNFFASTSCNIVLSKLSSATNLFSLAFSS